MLLLYYVRSGLFLFVYLSLKSQAELSCGHEILCWWNAETKLVS